MDRLLQQPDSPGGRWLGLLQGKSRMSLLLCRAPKQAMGNHRDFQGRWEFTLKQKELAELHKLNDRTPEGETVYVFLGDMTDIFHPDVPFYMLVEFFTALFSCNRLTFQVLTKRPGRMAHFANNVIHFWPSNVWAGTSVEQEWDGNRHLVKRLDELAKVPALVRYVSYEPALGPADFSPWLGVHDPDEGFREELFEDAHLGAHDADDEFCPESTVPPARGQVIHWIIAGGESGAKARPARPVWIRDVRDQCQAAGVPFFFKQWGEWIPEDQCTGDQYIKARERYGQEFPSGTIHRGLPAVAGSLQSEVALTVEAAERLGLAWKDIDGIQVDVIELERWAWVGKKAAGALLDGREWREMP